MKRIKLLSAILLLFSFNILLCNDIDSTNSQINNVNAKQKRFVVGFGLGSQYQLYKLFYNTQKNEDDKKINYEYFGYIWSANFEYFFDSTRTWGFQVEVASCNYIKKVPGYMVINCDFEYNFRSINNHIFPSVNFGIIPVFIGIIPFPAGYDFGANLKIDIAKRYNITLGSKAIFVQPFSSESHTLLSAALYQIKFNYYF